MRLMARQRLTVSVTVQSGSMSNGWAYSSVRPVEYIQPDTNLVGLPSPASTPGA
jgi:hypothetical protein